MLEKRQRKIIIKMAEGKQDALHLKEQSIKGRLASQQKWSKQKVVK